MAIIPQVITEDRASGAQVVDGSLKFDNDKSQYLTRTPSSAGNRKTWTWSGWVKKSNATEQCAMFSAGSGSNAGYGMLWFQNDGTLYFHNWDGVPNAAQTNALFRDIGWYHVVAVHDENEATAKMKFYVNGTLQSLAYNLTTSTGINDTIEHRIGMEVYNSRKPYDGSMSQVYFIDGQALGPEYFGFTDPLTNTWRPKKYTGDLKTSTYTIPDAFTYWTGMDQNWDSGGSTSAGNDYINQALPSSGKVYWEVTLNSPDIYRQIGIAQGASGTGTSYNDNIFGFYYNGNPPIWLTKNSSGTTRGDAVSHGSSTGTNWNDGDILMFAWDADNDKIWFGLNGTWYAGGDPANGINPIISGEDLSANNHYFKQGRTDGNNTTTLTNITSGSASYFSELNTIYVNRNTFYLPFDGSAPIGQDQSGNGNNWTPVNFGGSNTLEKATGALPILNTLGGTVARPGVFGSEENKYYTVTTADGSVYQFDITSGDNPSLSFIRGATYKFDYSSFTGHPVLFSSTNPDSSTTAYTDGTSIASNVISFTVPHDAPDTLYYYCQNHPTSMNGSISITTDTEKADPYAWKNVLALPLVGVKDDVSASINCTSTTKTTTVSGNAASNSASSNFYGSSFYFDGTDDALRTDTSDDLILGTGALTIECWFNRDNITDSYGVLVADNLYSSSGGWSLYTIQDDIQFYKGGSLVFSLSTVVVAQTWMHIAVQRDDSGNWSCFLNGIDQGVSASDSVDFTNNRVCIGANNYSSGYPAYDFNGYIQDVRIYKGVAKYTSDFVVPSTNPDILPDTPSGVSGSSKLTKIIDGAVSFDGSGDYLSIADSADFELGSGDFTLEAYVYQNNAAGSASDSHNILNKWDNSGTTKSYAFRISESSGQKLQFFWSTDGTTNNSITSSDSLSINRWHHVAVVNDGGTLTLYIDGRPQSTTGSAGTLYNSSVDFLIGRTDADSGSQYFDGFISNARVIKGTALYTTDFTPPTRTLTNVTNTSLLCCQSNRLPGEYTVSPAPGGLNDGTIWSSLVSAPGGYYEQYQAELLFNGDTSGNSDLIPAEGNRWTLTYDFGSVTTLEFFTYYPGGSTSNGANAFEVNGSTVTPSSKTNGGWTSLPIAGGTLTSFGSKNTSVSGQDYCFVSAIRVDGTILLDPIGVFGESKATNFNPFNTDINAVRGQESGYCTLNPLDNQGNTLSNGNLTSTQSTSSWYNTKSNISLSSGKWYYEATILGGSSYQIFGVFKSDVAFPAVGANGYMTISASGWGVQTDGNVSNNNSFTALVGAASVGDTLMIAFDVDGGKIWFGRNGIWASGGYPATGTNAQYTNLTSPVSPAISQYGSQSCTLNFGQKPFKFPPPEGFQPLNAANVRPVKVISRPDQYVGVTTYTGNGTSQTISGLNFSPDFVWIKGRINARNNNLYDTVRGDTNYLTSDTTNAEDTSSDLLTTFNSDGFSLGNNVTVNGSSETYAAWCWKAGHPDTASTGAVRFDGVGGTSDNSYLTVGSSADFAFGTGDFTIEYFLYMNAAPTSYFVPFDFRPLSTNGAYPQMNIDSSLSLGYYVNSGYRITTTLPIKKWLHIAVSRSGTSTKMFVDGVQVGSTYSDSTNYLQSSLTISNNQLSTTDYSINGFLSNFRIVKGTALYTSNFTPPTTELTNVTNTKLLCCQSTTSAGAAAVSPNISGLNDGRVFSANLTTNYGPVVNPSYAFNGVTDLNESVTGAFAASTAADISSTPAELSVTFSPAIPCTSSLRITSYDGGSGETIQYRVNNGSWTTIGDGSAAYEIFDIFAGVTGNQVTEVGIRRQKGNTNAGTVQLGMIEVDGTILLDPVASFEDAAATNFNPLDAFSVNGTGYSTASAAGLTAGTITPTGASVGTKQGFSIISYTGDTTSGGETLAHGLNETPKMVHIKRRDSAYNWISIITDSSGQKKSGYLDLTNALGNDNSSWDSNVITLSSSPGVISNGGTYVAYCWAEIPGFSKFGSYTAGSEPYVELGFKPAIVMIKCTGPRDTSFTSWYMADKERSQFNPSRNPLWANKSASEGFRGDGSTSITNPAMDIDLLSNGFKIKDNGDQGDEFNYTGSTYIYAAWAEAPEFNLYGAQSNAR